MKLADVLKQEAKTMTFSQKVALAFTIAGFTLLIPSTFGLLAAGLFLLEPSVSGVSFFLVILMIYAAGGALLRGYLNHTRFKYDRASSVWLWTCTIVYNAVPALMMGYFSALEYNKIVERTAYLPAGAEYRELIWLLSITSGYVLAVVLASLALRSDLKQVK